MAKKKSSTEKPYWAMNAKELAAATKQFDEPMVAASFQPLSAKGSRVLARLNRKRGRPKVGKGVSVVSISIEKQLLASADKLAKKLHVSRARLVARGLELAIAESQND